MLILFERGFRPHEWHMFHARPEDAATVQVFFLVHSHYAVRIHTEEVRVQSPGPSVGLSVAGECSVRMFRVRSEKGTRNTCIGTGKGSIFTAGPLPCKHHPDIE